MHGEEYIVLEGEKIMNSIKPIVKKIDDNVLALQDFQDLLTCRNYKKCIGRSLT